MHKPASVPRLGEPGGILKIVMSAEGYALDSYSLHPESSHC